MIFFVFLLQTIYTVARLSLLAQAASASGKPGSATARTTATMARMKRRRSARVDLSHVIQTFSFGARDLDSVYHMTKSVTTIKIAQVRISLSNFCSRNFLNLF